MMSRRDVLKSTKGFSTFSQSVHLARIVCDPQLTAASYSCSVFGSSRVHDGLPVLLNNPITKLFGWSPLIEDAFMLNKHLFVLSRNLPPPTPGLQYPPIPGLLALHVRRGDFEAHCPTLRRWNTRFSGLNTQPGTIDRDLDFAKNEDGSSTQRSTDAFQRACYPSTNQIVERVRQIRMTEEGKGLRNIFIMTNGSPEWIEELKEALMKDYRWKQISSSLEMLVTWEQKFTAQAVDMMIGQRADVFIGNGVSASPPPSLSLSSSSLPHLFLLVLEFNRDCLHLAYCERTRAWASAALGMKQPRSSFPRRLVTSITSNAQRLHHSPLFVTPLASNSRTTFVPSPRTPNHPARVLTTQSATACTLLSFSSLLLGNILGFHTGEIYTAEPFV